MVNLIIDGNKLSVLEGTTVLDAAKQIGIPIPSLCYLKDINDIGACRVCSVEIEGMEKLVAACNTVCEEGMSVLTSSPAVRTTRKTNVELILSQHDCQCAACVRSGNCSLQKLANELGVITQPYEKKVAQSKWSRSFPLIREASKCIKCMRCVQICDKVQDVNIWDVAGTGSRTTVDVSYNRRIKNSDCTLCGQCITHCPVGALRGRDDTDRAFEALANPDIITVVQIAPAVRSAWGESLGLTREFATAKRLVSALRKMGFNHIFDTSFGADITVMEEAAEFIKRFNKRHEYKFPMFTSCCPAWMRFLKSQYPDMVDQLSTTKSPQQMFGAVAKTYYAGILGVKPSKIFCVSIMPCIAKKQESEIPSINAAGSGSDVDLVLTTREIDRMIKAEHIVAKNLIEEDFDEILGVTTGAALIFGAEGGVMEAALRTAHALVTGKNPDADSFKAAMEMNGWREAVYEIGGIPIRCAIASGLGNARRLVEAIRKKQVKYDFVEIMACPGGCSGGGGQPISDGKELAGIRGENLYFLDSVSDIRFSHENPAIKNIYRDYLDEPLSSTSERLLHTDHTLWDMPLSPRLFNVYNK